MAGVLAGRLDAAVVCGDAGAVLRSLPDGCAPLLVADPPYAADDGHEQSGGYARRARDRGRVAGDGDLAALAVVLGESRRVLAPHGRVMVFASPRRHQDVAHLWRSVGYDFAGELVWDKLAAGLGGGLRYRHELVLLFARGRPKAYAALESVHSEVSPRHGRGLRSREGHPHEKPLGLLRKLVRYGSPAGALVLDPFAGSGSLPVACVQSGRRCVGAEIDPGYAAAALRRLESASGLGGLFHGVPDLFAGCVG